MIIDSHMQSLRAGKLALSAKPAIAANGNLLKASHSFDIEMQQISWEGMLITYHGRTGMQIAPAAQLRALQNAADRGRAESQGLGDAITGLELTTLGDDLLSSFAGNLARNAQGTRGVILQSRWVLLAKAAYPLRSGFRTDLKAGCGQLQSQAAGYLLNQLFSTAQSKSGILVNNHSVGPRKVDCSSQSVSLFPTEWNNVLKDHRCPIRRCCGWGFTRGLLRRSQPSLRGLSTK